LDSERGSLRALPLTHLFLINPGKTLLGHEKVLDFFSKKCENPDDDN